MAKAVFYITSGQNVTQYTQEARQCAETIKKWLGIKTVLLSTKEVSGFDEFHKLPPAKFKDGWYLNQAWYFNQAVELLKDYDELLYLDTDTYVCRDCSGLWRILENYDMAFGHAAGRGATPTACDVPSEFTTLGIGVNLFRNTDKTRWFFRDWLALFEKHYDVYGETDEGPFRDLLFTNYHDIRYFVLAPEEHCRFAFGVWLNGSVSILHGRAQGFTLPQVAEEINRKTSMRMYKPGYGEQGLLWYHPY
jgi:hypothetical protein